MKIRQYLRLALPALTLAAVLGGCGVLGGHKTTINPSLPDDRESIAKVKEQKVYTPEELKRGVVKGDWAIESVYGKKAVGEESPFIKFVPSEKRIYGNNGCNVINASYIYNAADSTISFDHMASTMRMCAKEGLTDYEINTALAAAKYYTWKVQDSDYYLTFFDESRREVMVLMHQNFEFLNGTWRVSRINDQPVNVEDMKLVLDVDEGKLHGSTGCNIINGDLETDMEHPNSISFSAIAMTRMACPDSRWETALVVALEEASAARPVSGNEVILYDDQQKQVLTLVRAADK